MPRTRSPRAGSLQFWPRVRSKYDYPRIRNWVTSKEAKPLGFAGYKVGMTHLLINDNNPHSLTKGTEIFCPITIIECPPIKTASIRFYKKTKQVKTLASETFAENIDKNIFGKLKQGKTQDNKNKADYDFLRILCYTQPSLTNIGRKNPDIFELAIGGSKEQQIEYAKGKLGNEIKVDEVYKEGQQLDVHSITKGKGFQGPVRRFGIQLRHHKSEKSRRNPGSLGSWRAQGQIMWRVAHAGKMGFHLRTEYNKLLVKIGNIPKEINVKGGFLNYGLVKNQYIMVKGTISGTPKRLVRFTVPIRQKKQTEAPQITYISLESKQGR